MNSISIDEIQNQLFFFSKESLKNIVLNSRCGIIHHSKSQKKHSPNSDDNIFDKYSPLICIYKKGKPKTISKDNLSWDESTFKKEINVISNALMTLNILELSEYYAKFNGTDDDLFKLSTIYLSLAKKQLDFYSTSLRNIEGFFVDKKISSSNESTFTDKKDKFKFSDQAFMMCAYYYYGKLNPADDDSSMYKNFSLDILKMLDDFKEDIYSLSMQECNKLSLALNVFYSYSNEPKAKELLLDIIDLINENSTIENLTLEDLELTTLKSINLYLTYKNTNFNDFNDAFMNNSKKHLEIFDKDKSLFTKTTDKKEIVYSSSELLNYIINSLLYVNTIDGNNAYESNIASLYKRILLNGQLATTWPDIPSIDSAERYKNSSLRSDDMYPEQLFKLPNITETPDICPIFRKEVIYSKKKEDISPSKDMFYSQGNMMIYFLIIHLFKNLIIEKNFNPKEEIDCIED